MPADYTRNSVDTSNDSYLDKQDVQNSTACSQNVILRSWKQWRHYSNYLFAI